MDIDRRTAEIAARVAATVAIMRKELEALRSELLHATKVSSVARDAAGNIITVTTTVA